MKKRLIGTLLLGALFVSSTSVFVSCKDYDDDINNVSDRVTVLEAAKVDLENQIAKLRADLEANYATKTALANAEDALNKSILAEKARAEAAEAALSTRIQTAQDAIDDLNTLIGGDISKSANFADCKTYKEALEKTWAKIESVETGLGNRLTALETDLNLDDPSSKIRLYLKNLENQIAALEAWQAGLDKDGGAATKNYVGTEIAAAEGRAALDAAQKAAQALVDAKQYTNDEINKAVVQVLKDAADDAKKKADAAEAAAKSFAQDAANQAEANAKKYAAEEAKAKADAAQAAAEKYAKEYADQKYNEALTEAQKMANAAEAAAKSYADQLLVQAKAYADEVGANTLTAAQTYADQKIAIAKAEAIAKAQELADAAESAAKTYTNEQIQKLKDNELKALSDRIDNLQSELNILNMFIKQLRSLVFIPEGYIDGVEALEVFSLNYWRYNNFSTSNWVDLSADANKNLYWTNPESAHAYNEAGFDKTATDKDRDLDHPSRYNKQVDLYRVLDFTAQYYMNPSNAQLDKITKDNVTPIVEEKWFDVTRAGVGAIGMSVDNIIKPSDEGGKPGIFQVKYKLTNPNKIKAGNDITVFATQVSYKANGADTTITSDYATFRNKYIDSLVLAHAPKEIAKSFRGVKNTHCGQCAVVETGDLYDHTNNHLFATITEAAGIGTNIKNEATGFAPQDSVWYTSAGLELNKLVETHYRDVNTKKHLWMKDISKYGLHYDFELTYLRYGSNKTSESAHAAIYKKDGKYYLVPWAPKKTNENIGQNDGEPNAFDPATYEENKEQFQTRQLIGRTPLVRVSLKDEAGNVLDYGYIRILITDTVKGPDGPASPLRRFVEYTAGGYSYNIPWTVKNGCAAYNNPELNFKNSWIDQQIDIYAFAGISHNEFITGWELEMDGNAAKQYAVSNKTNNGTARNGKAQFTALPTTTEGVLGTVTEVPNQNDPETNVLEWTVTAAQAKAAFIDKSPRPNSRTIAVRYKSLDGIEANDIYVIFNTGAISITEAAKITGTINWGDRKNRNYWYDQNGWEENKGLVDVHANVYGVEDDKEATGQTSELQQTIAATFMENKIVTLKGADQDAFITLTNGAGHTGKDLDLRLEFVKGALTSFNGIYTDGKIYKFFTRITDNGMTLSFVRDLNKNGKDDDNDAAQVVAKLAYTDLNSQDINHMRVEYQQTDYAKALLNYWPHKVLTDDVLTAYVAVKGKIGTCEIELSGEPIHIRFLRPINVKENPAEVEDASVNGKQVIFLRDIIKLDDWRDEPFKTNYWFYYGVTDIQVVGVGAGKNLANNEDVKTDMSLAPGATPDQYIPLKKVSEMVELQYDPKHYNPVANTAPAEDDFGTLTYTNLGSNVQKFTLQLPVKVVYIWGEVFTTVNVKVKCTKNNGARRF